MMKTRNILLLCIILLLVFVLPIYDAFFFGRPELLGVEVTSIEVDKDKLNIQGHLTNEISTVLNYDSEIIGDDLYITIKKVRKSFFNNDRNFNILKHGDFSNLKNIYLTNKVAKRQIWNYENEEIIKQNTNFMDGFQN